MRAPIRNVSPAGLSSKLVLAVDEPRRSAAIGGAVWVVLVGMRLANLTAIGAAEHFLLLGILVMVPLALGLLQADETLARNRFFRLAVVAQPILAIPSVLSFFVPQGVAAALLAAPWSGFCATVAVIGLSEILMNRPKWLPGLVRRVAMLFIAVGGAWFFVSRAGLTPMNFPRPIVLLTGVHFHFTGFAAPILFVAVLERFDSALRGAARAALRGGTVCVVLATPLLAAGFVFSPALKLLAVSILVVSVFAFSGAALSIVHVVRPPAAQVALGISAMSPIAGMLLAAVYAIGEFRGESWITIEQMVLSHGVLNGIGFVGCGLVAVTIVDWREARRTAPQSAAMMTGDVK